MQRYLFGALGTAAALLAPTAGAQDNDTKRIDRLEQQVEALTEALEQQDQGGSESSFMDRTSLGGYGEIHYNNLSPDDDGQDTEQVDFHRFILEVGHRFNENIRFFSELEFEHAVLEPEAELEGGVIEDENEGELKLEQGYVEMDINDRNRVQAGLFLVPAGIINETHEPPTFYGVERNQVESLVIPTTWAQTGGLLKGNLGDSGFSYDVGVHTGLDTSSGVIDDGVQLAAKAEDNAAATGRIKFTGIRGLELAATANYNNDIGQGSGGADDALLLASHAIYNIGGFKLTGLYGQWAVDGDVSDAAEDQSGGYVEGSYRFENVVSGHDLGVFARASNVDIALDDGATDLDRDKITAGVNYWVHPDVVFKADVVQQTTADAGNNGRAFDGFNLGIGYQF